MIRESMLTRIVLHAMFHIGLVMHLAHPTDFKTSSKVLSFALTMGLRINVVVQLTIIERSDYSD